MTRKLQWRSSSGRNTSGKNSWLEVVLVVVEVLDKSRQDSTLEVRILVPLRNSHRRFPRSQGRSLDSVCALPARHSIGTKEQTSSRRLYRQRTAETTAQVQPRRINSRGYWVQILATKTISSMPNSSHSGTWASKTRGAIRWYSRVLAGIWIRQSGNLLGLERTPARRPGH